MDDGWRDGVIDGARRATLNQRRATLLEKVANFLQGRERSTKFAARRRHDCEGWWESAGRGGVRWRAREAEVDGGYKDPGRGAIRSDFRGEIGARPGRGQGPGVHGSNKKKKKRHKELAAIADGDPRLIDKQLLLQCSATILSSVMQCSWQASSGSERRDWGRCSVDEGKGRQMEHAGGVAL